MRVRNLICSTLGVLGVQELDRGNRQAENELLQQPELDIARSITYTETAEDMLFEGVAWWRITEWTPEGWPRHVRRLDARSVTVQKSGKVWHSSETGLPQGQTWDWIPDAELIRFDSPWPALLKHGARTIRDAMAVAKAASKSVENPVPLGFLSPRDTTGVDPEDPPDIDDILDDFADAIERGAWPYLNAALQANKISWSPEELQFNQTRDAVILEIARMGGVDPEELGVSTTSRTYANSEQRRLDLIDFTINPFVVAMQDRLSMGDVTFPGNKVRFIYEGFLRSDTLTRMQVYEIGRRVGAYDDARIARIEEIPSARVATPAAPVPVDQEEKTVTSTLVPARSVQFGADDDKGLAISFQMPANGPEFKADSVKRTVTGLVIPWDVAAYSRGYMWMFAPGSLHWSDTSRVKLDKDHEWGSEFGKATVLNSADVGITGSFSVARGPDGDQALNYAEDGVYDGFSAHITFDSEGDGWIPHPSNPDVRYVQSGTLRKVALTAMPAFDDARVQSVAATRKDSLMTTTTVPPAAVAPPPFDAATFATTLAAGMGPAITAGVLEAVKALGPGGLVQPGGAPVRQVIPAGGGARVTREAAVYTMNGSGPSFVQDAWKSRTQGDFEARDRLLKFEKMTTDMVGEAMQDPTSFAINTGNASGVIPPGYRPDLYVSQLLKGRPLTNAISGGTIADASPFNIPAFVSSSGATGAHVEGVNPADGSLSVGTITVSPSAISGKYTITREIADSSNPAIDAIATQAMSESWSQQTEALVYAKLNGAQGVGGAITAGFVPSGAQAATTAGQGDELGLGVRQALALYPFRRFSAVDFGFLSQEATTQFAGAVDSTGRPLFPWVSPMNPLGGASQQGYFVDGVTFQPAWSMTGNAAGDTDVIMGNKNDVWHWESPVLNFRFEEVSGPANVVLALFGYFAVEVLRPLGLSGIRHTAS